jgi:ribose/xylose/arabinose/galactoside ABC-type transport system permease subunit
LDGMGLRDQVSAPPKEYVSEGASGVARPSSLRLFEQTEFQLLVGVILLAGAYSILYPESFPTWANLVEMARVGGILFVAAIGQSFALIIGGFDISLAANMGLVSIIAAMFMTDGGSMVLGVAIASWPERPSVWQTES